MPTQLRHVPAVARILCLEVRRERYAARHERRQPGASTLPGGVTHNVIRSTRDHPAPRRAAGLRAARSAAGLRPALLRAAALRPALLRAAGLRPDLLRVVRSWRSAHAPRDPAASLGWVGVGAEAGRVKLGGEDAQGANVYGGGVWQQKGHQLGEGSVKVGCKVRVQVEREGVRAAVSRSVGGRVISGWAAHRCAAMLTAMLVAMRIAVEGAL